MMENNLDIRHNKRFLIFPLLAVAAHFLLSNILYIAVEKLFLDILHIPAERFMNFSYLGEMLVYIALILVFFPVYKLLCKNDREELKTETNAKDSLLSIVAGLGVPGISFLWITLASKIPALQSSLDAMNAGNQNIGGGSVLGGLLIAVIAAPVIEEILFRGIVLRSLRKISPAWVAILVSSLMFGAYHMNPVQAVYSSVMGAVAGIIYEKKQNLIFPILVHITNNFVAMSESLAPGAENVINLFSLFMILPMGILLYRLLRKERRKGEAVSA